MIINYAKHIFKNIVKNKVKNKANDLIRVCTLCSMFISTSKQMLGFDDRVDRRRLYGAAEYSAHRAELQQLNGERDLRQWRAQHLRRRVLLEPSHTSTVYDQTKETVHRTLHLNNGWYT